MQGSLIFFTDLSGLQIIFSFQGQVSHLLNWIKQIFSWKSHYLIVIKFVCFS